MADTITVLDPTTFTHANATPYWDIDSPTESAVGTWAISIPRSASQARVVFRPNNAIVAVRVRMTKVTSHSTPTKTETQVLEWTSVDQNANLETGTIDVSDSFATNLHIDCCLKEGKTGDTDITVEIASEAGVDDAWTTARKFSHSTTGTGIDAAMAMEVAADSEILSLTNPVASNFDNDGKFKFILDGTIANSEIIFQISHTEDV